MLSPQATLYYKTRLGELFVAIVDHFDVPKSIWRLWSREHSWYPVAFMLTRHSGGTTNGNQTIKT